MNSNVHIGVHVLTAFPPSNPNRDDNGQPKTAIVGGVKRQRISSQCIKRTWRLSELMQGLETGFSTRTRGIGTEAMKIMVAAGMDAKKALAHASRIAVCFGTLNKQRAPETNEMVVIGHEERLLVMEVAGVLAGKVSNPSKEAFESSELLDDLYLKPPKPSKKAKKSSNDEVESPAEEQDDSNSDGSAKKETADKRESKLQDILQKQTTSLDVAMFGRMRAASPTFSVDASIAVSHPLTTSKATADSDFWTSVDDLKTGADDVGAGGMGDTEFGSGTYYTYVQISLDSLVKNLGGDKSLACNAVTKLIETIATTTPSGHVNSFNNHVRASFLRVEVGQPSGNLFCKAFEAPVQGTSASINALRAAVDAEVAVYGLKQNALEFSTVDAKLSISQVLQSVQNALAA